MKKLSMIIILLTVAACANMDMGRRGSAPDYNAHRADSMDQTYGGGGQ